MRFPDVVLPGEGFGFAASTRPGAGSAVGIVGLVAVGLVVDGFVVDTVCRLHHGFRKRGVRVYGSRDFLDRRLQPQAESRFGIPIFGTMAHSYVQVHDEEAAAVEAIARFGCLALGVPEVGAAGRGGGLLYACCNVFAIDPDPNLRGTWERQSRNWRFGAIQLSRFGLERGRRPGINAI